MHIDGDPQAVHVNSRQPDSWQIDSQVSLSMKYSHQMLPPMQIGGHSYQYSCASRKNIVAYNISLVA
jgi:hypothetical protein